MLSYQPVANFPSLFYLHPSLLLFKFVSPYQTSVVIFPPLVIGLLFTVSTFLKNAPTVHTTSKTLSPVLYAQALCANTHFLLAMRLWPSRHFDLGDQDMAGGFLIEQPDTSNELFLLFCLFL